MPKNTGITNAEASSRLMNELYPIEIDAADLRDRLMSDRKEYAATIPSRVRSWNSPEGERVAKMKSRLANLDGLISRLDDLASIREILAEDLVRLGYAQLA